MNPLAGSHLCGLFEETCPHIGTEISLYKSVYYTGTLPDIKEVGSQSEGALR